MSTRFAALWGSIVAATTVGVVAGTRWRQLEARRVELNNEYAHGAKQLQEYEEQRAAYVEQQKHYSTKLQHMCTTVDTLWIDRLQRYRDANRDQHAYLRVLPEAMGVLQGLTNHCRHLSHEVRQFVVFDVACAKVHSLSLLLDYARIAGLRAVAETIQRLYAAEPLVTAVCDTVLLTSTSERIPASVHECSESFQFCIQELNQNVLAAVEEHMTATKSSKDNLPKGTNASQSDDQSSGTLQRSRGSGDAKSAKSDSAGGSVWCDLLTRLLESARVDLMTESQRSLVRQRLQLQRQLERERYQLHTVEDVRSAMEYCNTIERYLNHDSNLTRGCSALPSAGRDRSLAHTRGSDDAGLQDSKLAETLRAVRQDATVQQSLHQLQLWSSSTAQYLIQDQALQTLECYLPLLSTTLTHINDN